MRYKQTLLVIVLSMLFALNALNALNAKAQVWEVGLQGGGANYMGDLNPTQPLKISGPSFGGFAKINFDPNWALSLNYNFGKIKADDAKSSNAGFRERNLSFSNKLHEFSLMVDFNFFDYFAGGGFSKFSPYLFTGIGGVIFKPKAVYQGKEYDLADYYTEGAAYKTYALTIPFGAGVKYRVSERWSLMSNIGYRNAYTDYLDDVSGLYPDASKISSDPMIRQMQQVLSDRSGEVTGIYTGAPNTQRGDFRKRDSYMFVGIGITYTFVSQKCF